MTTRGQILSLLEEGNSYEAAARRLGIAPGLAFMIATGLPADGSGGSPPEELDAVPALAGSSQDLIGPPAHNPTRDEDVIAWVHERARRELTRSQ